MWPSGDWSLPDPLTAPGAAPDAAPYHVCRFNESWLSLIVGSLERLKDRTIWSGDTAAIDDVLMQLDEAANQLATEYSPPTMTFPIGMITSYGGTTAPEGWLICNGASVSRTTYSDLFAILGVLYGTGDGITTFGLPDLSGRVASGAVAAGVGTGTSQPLGAAFGAEETTLGLTNVPPHSHNLRSSNGTLYYTWSGSAAGRYGLSPDSGLNAAATRLATESTGGTGGIAAPFWIIQPSLAVNFIIRATA
jgi:microcystin-dependent protein